MKFRAATIALALFALVPARSAMAGDGVAPVATITSSASLTGPLTVAFSEPVENVTAANVLIQAEGNPASIPASLQCRTSGNADVACDTR